MTIEAQVETEGDAADVATSMAVDGECLHDDRWASKDSEPSTNGGHLSAPCQGNTHTNNDPPTLDCLASNHLEVTICDTKAAPAAATSATTATRNRRTEVKMLASPRVSPKFGPKTGACQDVSIDFPEVEGPLDSNKSMFAQNAPLRRLEHPADKSLMMSFIGSLVYLVVALVVFCPICALVVVAFPFCWIAKRIMACCCCCAENNACSCCCSKLLTHSEHIWLHDTDFNQMIAQALITLENGIDLARIREIVATRVVFAEEKNGSRCYPRFTERVRKVFSGYAWQQDPDFTIEKHIYAMPGHIQNESDLELYLGQTSTRRLSLERPLWEVQVLTDFGEARQTKLLLRLHPSLSDGISLIQIFIKALADNDCLCTLKPRFGNNGFIFNAGRSLLIGPLVFLHKWIFLRNDSNILHGPSPSQKHVVAWSQPFSLARAIRIKQVTRSTLNDVLLSVVAGNLRSYFQRQGLSNPYNILASIPVDLRTDYNQVRMGTEFCLVDLTLPTNTEGAIPRLWEIKREMDEMKNSADPVVMSGTEWVLTNIFPECVYRRLYWSIWQKPTCVISNLQGPDERLTIGSREVKSVFYWMPPSRNVHLSISFMTYADQIRMSVIADTNIMPDPDFLIADFHEEMEKLAKLLSNRRIPGEHPGRRIMDHSHLHDNGRHKEPTLEELQKKMANVQGQLHDLKARLDSGGMEQYSEEERALLDRVEQLKEEFRILLAQMRRRRSTSASGSVSDDEDEEDGELRRSSYRKRTHSTVSRRSIVASMAGVRASIPPPPSSSISSSSSTNAASHQHRTPSCSSPSPRTPSSPSLPVSLTLPGQANIYLGNTYQTVPRYTRTLDTTCLDVPGNTRGLNNKTYRTVPRNTRFPERQLIKQIPRKRSSSSFSAPGPSRSPRLLTSRASSSSSLSVTGRPSICRRRSYTIPSLSSVERRASDMTGAPSPTSPTDPNNRLLDHQLDSQPESVFDTTLSNDGQYSPPVERKYSDGYV